MISYAIIYTSANGNTRRLAESMSGALGRASCAYMGLPERRALSADVIFYGKNENAPTEALDALLEEAKQKEKIIVPFGDRCFGGSKDLYAIGLFATNVMRHAEQILKEKREGAQVK